MATKTAFQGWDPDLSGTFIDITPGIFGSNTACRTPSAPPSEWTGAVGAVLMQSGVHVFCIRASYPIDEPRIPSTTIVHA